MEKNDYETTHTRIREDDHTTISLLKIYSDKSGSIIDVIHNLIEYLRWHTDAPRNTYPEEELKLMAKELDEIIAMEGKH